MSSSNHLASSKPCQYKRGGWCSTCQKYGEKKLKVTKSREKLKSGLWGYRTHRKVSCQTPALNDVTTFTSTYNVREDLGAKQTVDISVHLSENFTVRGNSVSMKSDQNSLETSKNSKKARLMGGLVC